jgi:hypothetical protein
LDREVEDREAEGEGAIFFEMAGNGLEVAARVFPSFRFDKGELSTAPAAMPSILRLNPSSRI